MGINLFNERVTGLISSAPLLWLTALLGLLSVIWNKAIRKHSAFLLSLLVCSFLSVCPGLYFRTHYFVLFLPILCILAAAGVVAIRDILDTYIKSKSKTAFISIFIILAVWLHSFYLDSDYLLGTDPVKLSRDSFGFNPFPEALQIADYIKKYSKADDKVTVLGSEPEIYFYLHKRSITPYIYTYPLMEPHPYSAAMQRDMISQIEANKPKFIVYFKIRFSWAARPDSETLIFKWVDQYIKAHYRQIGFIEMLSLDKTLYYWDSIDRVSRQEDWIYVGERID
jgi:hypothetical protein